MLVLILEDDQAIKRLVRDGLGREDIASISASTVAEGLEALQHNTFDVAILDLTLPDGSGLEVLERLRDVAPSVHIIVLSGSLGEHDRVNALELGADDYVVKPFFARELVARVRAVLRRQMGASSHIVFGAFELDLDRRSLRRGDLDVELSNKELDLLAFLASRPGHVFSRAELLRSVWQSEPGWQSESTVTEHVRRLRAKIEADPKRPQLIRTLRGTGYRFDLPAVTSEISDASRASHQVGVLTSVDSQIVMVDSAALALLGATDEGQLLGRSVLDLVADRSLAAAHARVDARMAGSHPRSQVLIMTSLQGEDLPIVLTGSPVRWDGQDAVRSELRHASDEAARFRELVTGVLSDVTDAVISTDMELHIRSWNRAAERLYGWTVSEVLGRHVLDVLDWLGDQGTLAQVWEQISSTGHWHDRLPQRTRDGSVIDVRSTVTVICDSDGETIGIAAVNRLIDHDADVAAAAADAETVADLRRGLIEGELDVYYQPVVDLADRRVITLEALVRWNHPTRGLLSPGSFLREAEKSGMITELGAHVLTVACSQVGSWRRAGIDVNLAVNLSARELADPMLVERIIATADSTGFDLAALWLEVTETALVEDVEQASARLHQLANLGVGISIDDFGTGWASLTYLRQFPIHVLKIDRSFVSGLNHEPQCAAIIRSILSLAAELDLIVVAEGIETIADEIALRNMGCSIGQGFLYGRPVPARDVDLHQTTELAALSCTSLGTPPGTRTQNLRIKSPTL